MIEIEADHSHFYPGATGRLRQQGRSGPVVVAFADGARATGRLAGDRLDLDPYTTTAGSRIGPRSWQAEIRPDGALRIAARLAPAG